MRLIRLTLAMAVGAIAGCASVPDPLEGEHYSEAFYPDQAVDRSLGAKVRWGGTVVETRPQADRTCIEILAHELGRDTRPRISDDGNGRFIACRNEFIDPEIFVNGREVTIVGELSRFQGGKIGEFDYEYPLVSADSVYLWPERDDYRAYGYSPYGYPYHVPYFYGFHGFYGIHRFHRPYFHGGHRLHSGSGGQGGGSQSGTKSK